MAHTRTREEYYPFILLNSPIPAGEMKHFINDIPKEDVREMAMAEYHYYCGEFDKAYGIAEKYLSHSSISYRCSAELICCYCDIMTGKFSRVHENIDKTMSLLKLLNSPHCSRQLSALVVLITNMTRVLFHFDFGEYSKYGEIPPLEPYIQSLSPGMRVWACFLMTRKAYNEKHYSEALGIVDCCNAMVGDMYIIPAVYLNLSGALCALCLKMPERASEYTSHALSLAVPDEIVLPFGEYMMTLHPIIESAARHDHPAFYRHSKNISHQFVDTWQGIHLSGRCNCNERLTLIELTIAFLAKLAWSNREIADHIGITENTVKRHLTRIYRKLGIRKRSELADLMPF